MAQEVTPDAIMQLGFGYWGSRTLLSAVELGLFRELARGPLDLRPRLAPSSSRVPADRFRPVERFF